MANVGHLVSRAEEVCPRRGRRCDPGGSGRQGVECPGVVMYGIGQCQLVGLPGTRREGVEQGGLI